METSNTSTAATSALQGYEEKIAAQIRAAHVRIDEFEAKAKPKRAEAEIVAINGLKAVKQNIERMLVDLKTTRDTRLQLAKADIDAGVVALQYTRPSEKK